MKDRRLDVLRAWWTWHRQLAGLIIVVLAFVALALLAMPFTVGTIANGTIVEFLKLDRRGGVDTWAVVDASGERVIVRLDASPDCRIGSLIALQKRQTPTGPRYSAPRGCRPAS